jgi:hypothetical protein
MKYSGLVPIRSTNEAYTPFSGLRKRMQHKRAQSEVPPISTSVMAIQCDSSEFLKMLPEKMNESPVQVHQVSRTQACSPFTNPALTRIYEIDNRAGLEQDLCQNLENAQGLLGFKRIEFGKIGDWNETYVLKNKNLNAHRLYDRKVSNEKGLAKRTCKIIEFSPNILTGCVRKVGNLNMWNFKSSEKGVFQMKGTLRLQKRLNSSNLKH